MEWFIISSSGLNAAVERYTQQQWFQTLGTQIQRVSNQIHAKTMRGGRKLYGSIS